MTYVPLFIACTLLVTTGWFVRRAANRLMYPRRNLAGGTPADYGLPFEPVSFVSQDGILLRGWFVQAENPRGTVIFAHGYAGSKAPDLQYVPQLREHGYSVLLFDFRAHGESGGEHSSMVYFERQDLVAAIEHLQQQGIEPIALMGFSMGAAVAMATAPLYSAVQAIIADSGFAELRTILLERIERRGFPRWIASILTTLTIWEVGRRLHCHLPDSDPLRWVARITPRPLLLIHGGQDKDVPVLEAKRLYQSAGEPKDIWIVPSAEHRCADQVCPDEYMARVLAFLDQWLAP